MSILKVYIPSFSKSKIEYTINCLLGVFLGLEFEIIEGESSNVLIKYLDHNLIIENHFFGDDHFSSYKIPHTSTAGFIKINSVDYIIESIFGPVNYIRNGNDHRLSTDIISSTFFMLSRWEELDSSKSDNHKRFQAKDSLAFRSKFLERPIVNEYIELLWAIFIQMGCTQKRTKRNFEIVPTHDIDKPYLFSGLLRNLRYVAGTFKRQRFSEFYRYINKYKNNDDPYDTYDMIMDLSERTNTRSHFFILQKGKSRADENHEINTPKIKKLIAHIQNRGHNIGFHPSYYAYNDNGLFQKEKKALEKVVGQEVTTGRNHFLRWDVSQSPKIWEDNSMEWDSTLGYADHAGFRCGVCYPFPLYDLDNDKQLDVYERPLIAMEWSLIHYQGLDIVDAEHYIQKLKNEVKKYNGEFVFLYHNSAFFTDEYYGIEERLLDSLYSS